MIIPTQLQKDDLRFVLLQSKEKKPFEKEWQLNNYSYNDPKLVMHLANGGNYGVIGGHGNLIIIDFDSEEVQNKIVDKLPQTFTVKSGSGLLHKYYRTDNAESFKVMTITKDTLADIQGKGKQVVGPGSIHPNGKEYEVVDTSEISNIDFAEIRALFDAWLPAIKPKHKAQRLKGPSEVMQEIKSKIIISDVLRDIGIDTKKNPTQCPLHDSKGGKCLSFDDDKGLWNCFHCGEGGDVIELYRLHKDISFKKAIEEMAKKYNIITAMAESISKTMAATISAGGSKIPDLIIPRVNIENFCKMCPFFYDKNALYWFWNIENKCWEQKDEVDVMIMIDKTFTNMGNDTTKSGIKNQYLECIKRVGRVNVPKLPPKTWIQFRDQIFDISTKTMFEASPEYFICNPLPYAPAETSNMPTIDRIFGEWVGESEKEKLYQIIAYCCLADYPIHLIFCFTGPGSNGKTKLMNLIMKFVGRDNICSTELDVLINSRFESSKLYKKLVCTMGETDFGLLSKTAILKKLVGQDSVSIEFKNKMPFDEMNYAKICISSNNLPITEDTSDGYFRRWLITDFPNRFKEGKDILATIPEEEYNALARKCIEILPDLLDKGEFINQGSIEDRKHKYIMSSNPFTQFLKEVCYDGGGCYSKYSEFYAAYSIYLERHNKRPLSKKAFSTTLTMEAIEIEKTWKKYNGMDMNDRWVMGWCLKPNWKDICEGVTSGVNSYEDFRAIIQKNLTTQPVLIDVFLSYCKDFDNKLIEKYLQKAKNEGEICENPAGYIARL